MVLKKLKEQKLKLSLIIVILTILFSFYYLISGCGGGGGGTITDSTSIYYPNRLIEIEGNITDTNFNVLNLNYQITPYQNNISNQITNSDNLEIIAEDQSNNIINNASGYVIGKKFFLTVPLTNEYGRYLVISIKSKDKTPIFKKLLGKIPRYDDVSINKIIVSNVKIDSESTAKTLVLLENKSKLPPTEIQSANGKTNFEIEADKLIEQNNGQQTINALKQAHETIIKALNVNNNEINKIKQTYLLNTSNLLESFVKVAQEYEKDSKLKDILPSKPQVTINNTTINSNSTKTDINLVVTNQIENIIVSDEILPPIFDPPSKTSDRDIIVTISTKTSDAIIKYLLNSNNDPTENYGLVYVQPLVISNTTTIKAIAVKNGKASKVSSATYTIIKQSILPIDINSISIGNQNGPIDYIYKKNVTILPKSFETTQPFFEIEFRKSDNSNNFSINDTNFLRFKLHLIKKDINNQTQILKYAYGYDRQVLENDELDFSEDFNQPQIYKNYVKFSYKFNPKRKLDDGNYELKIVNLENVSYTDPISKLLYTYNLTNPISGFFIISTSNLISVEKPYFSHKSGEYNNQIYVSILSNEKDVMIRYTQDGSDPTPTYGEIYNNIPILVNVTKTIKAIAYKNNNLKSDISIATYVIKKVASPEFNPKAGIYSEPITVTLTSKTPNAKIYYTDDPNTMPTKQSILYTGPFTISESKIIKAIAVLDDMLDSEIITCEYKINKVSDPEFNLLSGTYAGPQTISMYSKTEGAIIRYTLDGTNPTKEYGTIYSSPILLSTFNDTIEIKAIAYKPGLVDSNISIVKYRLLEKVKKPKISLPSGTYEGKQTISITCDTNDAIIYYTLDNTVPTSNSIRYTNPFEINTSVKVRAIAIKNGMANSDEESATYIINIPRVKKPIIIPSSGTYAEEKEVNMTCETDGAIIYYTIDETNPTNASTKFQNKFKINQTTYIKAVAYKDGMQPSEISESYIIINLPRPTVKPPQFNLPSGTYEYNQEIIITCETPNAKIYYTTDGSRPTTTKTLYQTPIILKSNVTIKAIATNQPDYTDSEIVTCEYYVKTPKPIFSIESGTYTDAKTLIISSSLSDAQIYYSTDGSEPKLEEQYRYKNPIVIDKSMEVKAFAHKPGLKSSDLVSKSYVIRVKDPIFNPLPGNYDSAQTITLTCETPNAIIYYTLDGSTPNTNSNVYVSPILIENDAIIKAFAYKQGLMPSNVVTGSYIVKPKVKKPYAIPPGGVYNSSKTITLACETSGAVIKYTLDGSDPRENGLTYSTPIEISQTKTLKCIAVKEGMLESDVSTYNYTIDSNLDQVKLPNFNLSSGVYEGVQTIQITCETENAQIYYTIDGSYPTSSSLRYTSPFQISENITIKAIAIKEGMAYSDINEITYHIKVPKPIFQPDAGTYDGFKDITLSCNMPNAIIRYTIDGSTPSKTNGIIYNGKITLTQNTLIKAIAYKNNTIDSDIESKEYKIKVLSPIVSLTDGTYEGVQNITITCPTNDAVIRYTLDGSDPTETNGQIYTQKIVISENTILKVIAYKNNMENSQIVTKNYIIKVPKPGFSPQPGSYSDPISVTISNVMPNTEIYYTLDGSTPTTSSTKYVLPIQINESKVIKAIATKSNALDSDVATAVYTIQPIANPQFDPDEGTYIGLCNVKITCQTQGASIYYTLDGSIPNSSSLKYTSPILVEETKTIKAIAIKESSASQVITKVYTISPVPKVQNVQYNQVTKILSWDPVSVPNANEVKYYINGTATLNGIPQQIPEQSTYNTTFDIGSLINNNPQIPPGVPINLSITVEAAAIFNTIEKRGQKSDTCNFTIIKGQ